MIFLIPLLLIIGMGPSLFVWALAAYFSPEGFNIRPYRMLCISFAMAFCIGVVSNVELAAGLLSGVVLMVVGTFIVTLVFMPIHLMYKRYRTRTQKV